MQITLASKDLGNHQRLLKNPLKICNLYSKIGSKLAGKILVRQEGLCKGEETSGLRSLALEQRFNQRGVTLAFGLSSLTSKVSSSPSHLPIALEGIKKWNMNFSNLEDSKFALPHENDSVLSFLNDSLGHNFTYDTDEDPIAELRMTFGLRLMWDLLFGSAMGISILGNSIIIWIILGKKNK